MNDFVSNVPQLEHYQFKEYYPSFIVMSNVRELLNPSNDDFYFTYDEDMFCRGAYSCKYDYARGFGDNPDMEGKQGFTIDENGVGEEMFLGYYKASTGEFYELKSATKFLYGSLKLYKVNDIQLGNQIQLEIDPNLTIVSVDIYGKEGEVKLDDYFFYVETSNAQIAGVIASMQGEVVQGKWWVPDLNKFCNFKYIPEGSEKNVNLTAYAVDDFTGTLISTNKLVEFKQESEIEPPPEPDVNLLYEEDRFKIITKPKFGKDCTYIEGNDNIKVTCLFTKTDGSKYTNSLSPSVNDGRGMIIRDDVSTIHISYIYVNDVIDSKPNTLIYQA